MTELNTQLNTGGKLCGKSKWGVRKTRTLGDWEVWNPDTLEATYFPTWRKALDYVNHRLCSTPPRGPSTKHWHVRRRKNDYKITRFKHGDASQSLHIGPADLAPLAQVLLKAHQQEVAPCPGQPANPA